MALLKDAGVKCVLVWDGTVGNATQICLNISIIVGFDPMDEYQCIEGKAYIKSRPQ